MLTARKLAITFFLAFLFAGVVVAATLAVAPWSKLPPDPWAGKSDADRQADVQSTYDDHSRYIRAFNSGGKDPRSLRREPAEAFAAGPETLEKALQASSVVALGVVRGVTFEPVPGQWLGRARVSVDVLQNFKGGLGGTIEVIETASPAPSADGNGVLQEIDVAPVLLQGDRVLLMLTTMESGELTPVAGSGILYVDGGRGRPLPRSPLLQLVAGRSEAELLALYADTLARLTP